MSTFYGEFNMYIHMLISVMHTLYLIRLHCIATSITQIGTLEWPCKDGERTVIYMPKNESTKETTPVGILILDVSLENIEKITSVVK